MYISHVPPRFFILFWETQVVWFCYKCIFQSFLKSKLLFIIVWRVMPFESIRKQYIMQFEQDNVKDTLEFPVSAIWNAAALHRNNEGKMSPIQFKLYLEKIMILKYKNCFWNLLSSKLKCIYSTSKKEKKTQKFQSKLIRKLNDFEV